MAVEAAESEVMTCPEVARVLGVSRGIAYDYARRNLIPNHRLGGRIIIPRRAFYEWLNRTEATERVNGD